MKKVKIIFPEATSVVEKLGISPERFVELKELVDSTTGDRLEKIEVLSSYLNHPNELVVIMEMLGGSSSLSFEDDDPESYLGITLERVEELARLSDRIYNSDSVRTPSQFLAELSKVCNSPQELAMISYSSGKAIIMAHLSSGLLGGLLGDED